MTREELEQKARMLAQNNWPDVASKLIIALVVEACCAEIKSFCFTVRETGDQALTRHLEATFLPTEKPALSAGQIKPEGE